MNGERSLLVLAGAGSGKTSVLVARAGWLLARGEAAACLLYTSAKKRYNHQVLLSTGQNRGFMRTILNILNFILGGFATTLGWLLATLVLSLIHI